MEIIFPVDTVTGVRKPTDFAMTNCLLNIDKWDYTTVMENEELYLDMIRKTLRLEGRYGMELRNSKQGIKDDWVLAEYRLKVSW